MIKIHKNKNKKYLALPKLPLVGGRDCCLIENLIRSTKNVRELATAAPIIHKIHRHKHWTDPPPP